MNSYSSAISVTSEGVKGIAVYYSNRAMCHLKSENYGSAIEDGEAAIAADPAFPKGYYRKGSGYFGLGKFDEALACFKSIQVKLKVNDAETNKKIQAIKTIQREKAFAESISRPDEMDKIDHNSITVPESYTGPVIEETTEITEEFVKTTCSYMSDQKFIHKKYIWILLRRVAEILDKEETLVSVHVEPENNFTVCGDIHGQFYDLLNIWSKNGWPSVENPYLFNGDFVDRGSFSVECILALYLWKAHNPKAMFMNRGNHEGKGMNKLYGFEGEVKHKYCDETMILFAHTFNLLPLCHVINHKVMVVHGGLFSQDGVKLEDIRKLNRKGEIPESGIMCDLLWSDPHKGPGRIPSKRGVSIQFGPDIAEKFLDDNGLGMIYFIKKNRMSGQVS